MVESIIMLRSEGEGTTESPFGPRQADLATYNVLRWEDVSARAADAIEQLADPRVVVIRAWMNSADALAASTDTKIWLIASRVFNADGEVTQTNRDEVYPAQERAVRIEQLSNILGFDKDQIEAWWIAGRTRGDVATKLRKYVKDRLV